MHRFYLPPEKCKSATLTLTEREAHHALHVLRLEAGDEVTVLDGAGDELLCTVTEAARKTVQLAVVEKKSHPPLPARVTLLQALPKGKLMDSIVQKATELGVARIVPLLTERTVSHVDGESAAHRVEKWRLAGMEAIKQCGSPWLPEIESPVMPEEFLARKENFDLALVASLQANARSARGYFEEFRKRHSRLPKSVCVWVGPEGDFSPKEYEAIAATGVLPITLGQLVLRMDTAAVACLAILNHELNV
ncbi:MAG TPA: RsmE family RNA methyltransferase [Verrucomicrobiae bacterium]|jgi:16S rRNA (uracil1498-N3)-methyltransferase|nr:RsmE family RNA methyltransferase [Verrucomicrobiae bacterium]